MCGVSRGTDCPHRRDAGTDGVFGFPFFLFRGQRFWGNDRIEWLVRAIQASA